MFVVYSHLLLRQHGAGTCIAYSSLYFVLSSSSEWKPSMQRLHDIAVSQTFLFRVSVKKHTKRRVLSISYGESAPHTNASAIKISVHFPKFRNHMQDIQRKTAATQIVWVTEQRDIHEKSSIFFSKIESCEPVSELKSVTVIQRATSNVSGVLPLYTFIIYLHRSLSLKHTAIAESVCIRRSRHKHWCESGLSKSVARACARRTEARAMACVIKLFQSSAFAPRILRTCLHSSHRTSVSLMLVCAHNACRISG